MVKRRSKPKGTKVRYRERIKNVYHRSRSRFGSDGKDALENALVFAGAGVDSYLTTKQSATFGKGYSMPSASGSKVNVPYLELLGIAGGLGLPFVSKGKLSKYGSKFLTGMGANGVAKMADPPSDVPSKDVLNIPTSWENMGVI